MPFPPFDDYFNLGGAREEEPEAPFADALRRRRSPNQRRRNLSFFEQNFGDAAYERPEPETPEFDTLEPDPSKPSRREKAVRQDDNLTLAEAARGGLKAAPSGGTTSSRARTARDEPSSFSFAGQQEEETEQESEPKDQPAQRERASTKKRAPADGGASTTEKALRKVVGSDLYDQVLSFGRNGHRREALAPAAQALGAAVAQGALAPALPALRALHKGLAQTFGGKAAALQPEDDAPFYLDAVPGVADDYRRIWAAKRKGEPAPAEAECRIQQVADGVQARLESGDAPLSAVMPQDAPTPPALVQKVAQNETATGVGDLSQQTDGSKKPSPSDEKAPKPEQKPGKEPAKGPAKPSAPPNANRHASRKTKAAPNVPSLIGAQSDQHVQEVDRSYSAFAAQWSDLAARIRSLGYAVDTRRPGHSFDVSPQGRSREAVALWWREQAGPALARLEAEYRRKVHVSATDPDRRYHRIEEQGLLANSRTDASRAAARDVAAAGNPWALQYAAPTGPDGRPLSDKEIHDEIIRRVYAQAGERVADEYERRAAQEAPGAARADAPGLPERGETFERFDLGEGLTFDREWHGDGVLYGAQDGATPLATLKRVERRDALYRPYVEYVLPDAPEIGPVVVEEADGDFRVVRPKLLQSSNDAEFTDRTEHLRAIAAAQDYRLEEIDGRTWNPETQTMVATIVDKSGKRERRRIPIFILPDNPRISYLWMMELTAPNAGEYVANLDIKGDRASTNSRRKTAQDRNREDADAKYNYEMGPSHLHEFTPSAGLMSQYIVNGVYGVVARVPREQNRAHAGWYGQFTSASKLKTGDLYLYLHVPRSDFYYKPSLPGAKDTGRDRF